MDPSASVTLQLVWEWEHKLQKAASAQSGATCPRCLAGQLGCEATAAFIAGPQRRPLLLTCRSRAPVQTTTAGHRRFSHGPGAGHGRLGGPRRPEGVWNGAGDSRRGEGRASSPSPHGAGRRHSRRAVRAASGPGPQSREGKEGARNREPALGSAVMEALRRSLACCFTSDGVIH